MLMSPQIEMTESKQQFNGRWTRAEHALFLKGCKMHGRNWKKVSELVVTRNNVQCRTHAQKHFKKTEMSLPVVPVQHAQKSFTNVETPIPNVPQPIFPRQASPPLLHVNRQQVLESNFEAMNRFFTFIENRKQVMQGPLYQLPLTTPRNFVRCSETPHMYLYQ